MRSSAVSQLSNGGSAIAVFLLIFFFLFSSLQISLVNATQNPLSNPNVILLPSQNEIDHHLDSSDLALGTCTKVNPALNYRPVIGILSQPGDGASGRLSNATHASYIPASYVKFAESAGARVIPLIYNDPPEVLDEKLSLVNGAIFIGGKARKGLYYSVAGKIFKKILERNDAGDYVPLYGIAQGFQIISALVDKDKTIVVPFNASRLPSTLQLIANADIRGTVIERVPRYLRKRLAEDCIAWQNHIFAISPKTFDESELLSNFFQVLTTSIDRDNKVYVSTANAKNYPVTIFQWGPEKNAFEWGIPTIPHTGYAVEVTQKVASFLISEARKSINKPPAQKILDNLIYNYSPVYGGKAGKGYDQVYIFQ